MTSIVRTSVLSERPIEERLLGRVYSPKEASDLFQYKRRTPPYHPSAEQIEELLRIIPKLKGAEEEAVDLVQSQLIDILRKRMHSPGFYVEDTEEWKQKYIELTTNLFESSRIPNGEAIGILSSLAISAPVTQLTVKAGKSTKAGTDKIQSDLSKMESILRTQEESPFPSMTVHFRMKVTKEMVISLNAVFTEVTVKDLLDARNPEIAKLSDKYKVFGDELPRNVAHDVFDARRSQNLQDFTLRIFFDRDKMFENNVTPFEIAKVIKASPNFPSTSQVIPSSFVDGFVDIISGLEAERDVEKIANLHHVHYGVVENMIVKGLSGIKGVDYKKVDYSHLLEFPRKPYSYEDYPEDLLVMMLNMKNMATHAYPYLEFLKDSIAKAGLEIVEEIQDKYSDRTIGFLIESFEGDFDELFRNLEDIDRYYCYAITEGVNAERACLYPWVDTSRLVVNSLPKMRELFGIEATWWYDYYEVATNLGEGMQSRFIILLVTDTCYFGIPLGISHHNNKKKPGKSFINEAVGGHAVSVLTTAAANSKIRRIETNREAVFTQGEILLGSYEEDLRKTSSMSREARRMHLDDLRRRKVVLSNSQLADRIKKVTLDAVGGLKQEIPNVLTPSSLPLTRVHYSDEKEVSSVIEHGNVGSEFAPSELTVSKYTRDLENLVVPVFTVDRSYQLTDLHYTSKDVAKLLVGDYRLEVTPSSVSRFLDKAKAGVISYFLPEIISKRPSLNVKSYWTSGVDFVAEKTSGISTDVLSR